MSYERLGDIFDDIVGLPGKAVDAAAGGPLQRARAHAATARADALRAQTAGAQAGAAEAAAQVAQQAAARVTEMERVAAAEAAASKKKLIKTLAIGGGAAVGLGVLIWLITRN